MAATTETFMLDRLYGMLRVDLPICKLSVSYLLKLYSRQMIFGSWHPILIKNHIRFICHYKCDPREGRLSFTLTSGHGHR
jgi:hypothetical protein